jgi:3-oxoacyl-[acyl-carrier protein] reductase
MSRASVILVTGGSKGLGLTLVRGLLGEGYTVACLSRTSTPEWQQTIDATPDRLTYIPGDLASSDTLSQAVSRIEDEIGPIDALVNNAGIAHDGVLPTMPPPDIERLVNVNLVGTLLLTRLVTRQMVRRSRGNIVTVSSIVGLRGYSGLAAYAATKAGLDGMTRALARELGPRRIRANSIAPGYLETDMTELLDANHKEQIVRRTPLGRLGRPDDVVGTLLFLLSPASAFITGQTIVIDGGIIN